MGKMRADGRSKTTPFVKLHRGITGSAAWRSLSCEGRALLIEIWTRHNGQNNGAIPYSHREAREQLGIGSSKVRRAFDELTDRGFIVARVKASFDWKGGGRSARATEWELTAEPFDRRPPKATYRNFKIQSTAPEVTPMAPVVTPFPSLRARKRA